MAKRLLQSALNCRRRIIDTVGRRILLARLAGSGQESDLTLRPNCHGYGRIHHFNRNEGPDWPEDPLPNEPASRALGIPASGTMRAEVFQCAQCNFDCWYCFVPRGLRRSEEATTAWFSADQLMEAYLSLPERPPVVDLSGGNPELVPEWAAWMAQCLRERKLSESVYLWSDGNLGTDFHGRFLSRADREALRAYKSYGQVGCFKGFDDDSFAFNTGMPPTAFSGQFDAMAELLALGVDQYGYVTLTSPTLESIEKRMKGFLDRLQGLAETLPLRVVPLQIERYGVMVQRLTPQREAALRNQFVAVQIWQTEIENRFPQSMRDMSIVDVPLP